MRMAAGSGNQPRYKLMGRIAEIMSHDNVQFVLIFLSIFAGILFNNRGLDKLEARLTALQIEIGNRFNNVDNRIDKIHQDFGTFHSVQGNTRPRLMP